MMNAQNLDTAVLSQTAQQTPQVALAEHDKDSFSQSLLLWMASFPLFAIGLSMLSGTLHTIGYILVLGAVICFLSPVVQLLGCLTEKK